MPMLHHSHYQDTFFFFLSLWTDRISSSAVHAHHRIIEYAELEGTCHGHRVQPLALPKTRQESRLVSESIEQTLGLLQHACRQS